MTLKRIRNYLVQHTFKRALEFFPSVYIMVQRYRYASHPYSRKIVSSDTDIIIEGYPRSANSFSVKAFMFANGDDYKIATHQHAAPQVVLGVKLGIPTIVLIRDPKDAVLSYAALRAKTYGLKKFQSEYKLKWLLEDYVAFYEHLLPLKDEFVTAKFESVLKDYGIVIDNVNHKYGTTFKRFEHSEENVARVFSKSKEHLSPSQNRNQVKEIFIEDMNALLDTNLYQKAERIYNKFIA